ncbi:MAG TPA: hypothetical protein VMF07_05065 [Solirubrobacteraceae bacterium]|nr:hypothetical protein [Solirubrobacteraceae bacterium]
MSRAALARTWLVWWVLGMALWLLLEDLATAAEDVDGAVAAAIGATAAVAALRHGGDRVAASHQWLSRAWRPPVALIGDLPLLLVALTRAIAHGERDPGRVRTIPFDCEQSADRRAAQIALATVAGSLSPSAVVIAVCEGELIFHELVPSEGRGAADPLELG